MHKKITIRRIIMQIWRRLQSVFRRRSTIYVSARVDEYCSYWKAAAKMLGAEFVTIDRGIWEISLDGRSTRIANDTTEADDPVTLILAGNKSFCAEMAASLDIPTAVYGQFTLQDIRAAKAIISSNGGRWVVKPASGVSSGRGITTQIESSRELETAFILASLYDYSILLERFVPAESCRLLYLNGDLIHAVRRSGARVVGDGSSSIHDLVKRTYPNIRRNDPIIRITVESQGLNLSSVLPDGACLVVRPVSESADQTTELRTIYDENITEQVGRDLERQLGELVKKMRCNFAGVDILTNDVSRSLQDSSGVFLEVNTTPSIHHHYVDAASTDEIGVALPVLEFLLSR